MITPLRIAREISTGQDLFWVVIFNGLPPGACNSRTAIIAEISGGLLTALYIV